MSQTQEYRFKWGRHSRTVDGKVKVYGRGDPIELTGEEAERLGDQVSPARFEDEADGEGGDPESSPSPASVDDVLVALAGANEAGVQEIFEAEVAGANRAEVREAIDARLHELADG